MFVLVDDVDGMYAKGLEKGATGNQEPGDRGYGRAAGFIDKWGNQVVAEYAGVVGSSRSKVICSEQRQSERIRILTTYLR